MYRDILYVFIWFWLNELAWLYSSGIVADWSWEKLDINGGPDSFF